MPNRYRLTTTAVDAYETQKVKSIFGPLARATLSKVQIADHDQVLDVACGTGIMARAIREIFGPAVPISGVDLNGMMIAKARTLTEDLPGHFDWYVSDATNIPAPSSAFSYVFCQQGLQYFADDLAALAEMRRVLTDDGTLVLTVWAPANKYFLAQSAAMSKYVSAEAGEKALVPFAYSGERRIPDILTQLGFKNVTIGTVSIDRIILDAEHGIGEDILGSPLGPMVNARGPAIMEEIIQYILSECSGCMQGADLVVPQHSTLIMAYD